MGYAPEVDISVDEDMLEKSIIPMLILLPLENICKYAVLRHATQEAWIRIKQEDGLLVIHAENEVHGTRKSNTVSTQNGLLNMKEKLRYMDVVYHLEHDTVDGRYVFRLALQVD